MNQMTRISPLFPTGLFQRRTLPSRFRGAGLGGGHWLIGAILLSLAILIAWASMARIDELVRARAQVIAAARTQVIQAADSGVLAEVLVREGQFVRRGELLVRFDQARARAAFDDSNNKVAALKASLSRLRAEVYGTPLVFPAELAAWPMFRENQSQLYDRRRRAMLEGIASLENSKRGVDQELAITAPLLATGDVGQVEVIRLRRAQAELEGQIANARNKYFQDAQTEMTKAEEDLATQEELLRERTTVLSYTELRAPVDGQVRKINFTTVGASVRPGDPVLEILPTTSQLIVEAKYQPQDVASLRLGLPATVKLDAYDSSIYGSLTGKVVYISPDALSEQSPQGEHFYYRVHIRLDPPTAEAGRKPVPVTAGMTATVEVRSRKRSVFNFLTKPITKTLNESMNER